MGIEGREAATLRGRWSHTPALQPFFAMPRVVFVRRPVGLALHVASEYGSLSL
ncbi:MAG: hypothetical protein QOI59_7018 [Gammaproteobacteria bacterium]|nr:hypothetical protein [Gammaproteobacteria bacterium]